MSDQMDRRRFNKLLAAAGGGLAATLLTPTWKAPFVEIAKLRAQGECGSPAGTRVRPPDEDGGPTSGACATIRCRTVSGSTPVWYSPTGEFSTEVTAPPEALVGFRVEAGELRFEPAQAADQLLRPTGAGANVLADSRDVLQVEIGRGGTLHRLEFSAQKLTDEWEVRNLFCYPPVPL